MKKKVILGILFVVVFIAGYFVGDSLAIDKVNVILDEQREEIAELEKVIEVMEMMEDKTEEPQSEEPQPEDITEWKEVKVFEGEGIKDTETFKISSDEWRMHWSTTPTAYGDMNFQIYIYDKEQNLAGLAANVIGEGEDISYQRGSGDYYLTINSAQKYKIIIEEK